MCRVACFTDEALHGDSAMATGVDGEECTIVEESVDTCEITNHEAMRNPGVCSEKAHAQ